MKWSIKAANYPSAYTTKEEDDLYHSLLVDGYEPFSVTREEQVVLGNDSLKMFDVIWFRKSKVDAEWPVK